MCIYAHERERGGGEEIEREGGGRKRVRMCVCACLSMCVCVYMPMHAYTYTCTCIISTCMHTCVCARKMGNQLFGQSYTLSQNMNRCEFITITSVNLMFKKYTVITGNYAAVSIGDKGKPSHQKLFSILI